MERWPHTLHHGCDHPRKMENLTWEDTRKWFGYSCGQFILVLFFSHQSDHQWYLLHLFSCLPSLPTCLANDSAESNPNPTCGARWPSAQQTWLNRLDWQERRICWSKIWSESILVAGRCTLFCPADCPASCPLASTFIAFSPLLPNCPLVQRRDCDDIAKPGEAFLRSLT